MSRGFIPKPFLWTVVVLVLVQLACGLGSGNAETPDQPDFAATESALQSTQNALDAQAQQAEQQAQQQAQQPTATTAPPPRPTQAPTDAPTLAPTTPPEPQTITYSSGDIIYFTDFLGTSDWEDGWVHFSIPDADYTVYKDDDFLHVEVPITQTTVYLVYDDLYFERDKADVYVETEFRNLSTHNINQVGVMCRASADGWYEFNLLSGGLWYIWKYDGLKGEYKLLKNGGISKLDYDAPHVVGASCEGDTLSFYLDGGMIKNATVKENSLREGQVGISVFAEDQWPDVIIEFDYFGVQAP